MNSKPPKIRNKISIFPPSTPTCISFSPINDTLAVGTEESGVLLYDINSSEIIKQINIDYKVNSITWDPSGSMLAIGSNNRDSLVFSVDDCKKLIVLSDNEGARTISWSSNGKSLAIGSFIYSDADPYMHLWNTTTWKKIENSLYRSSYVSFSPDGKYLAFQYRLDGIKVVNTNSLEEIVLLDFSDSKKYVDIFSPSWSPNGIFIAASCGDGRIRIWQTSDWSVIRTLKLHGFWDEAKYQVAFSPDSRYLVSGGFGTPKLISTSNWQEIYEFEEVVTSDYLDISWNSNGKYLAFVQTPFAPIEIFELTK